MHGHDSDVWTRRTNNERDKEYYTHIHWQSLKIEKDFHISQMKYSNISTVEETPNHERKSKDRTTKQSHMSHICVLNTQISF